MYVYVCLEACDYFVAWVADRRRHWVCWTSACWMSMCGQKKFSTRAGSSSVEHMAESDGKEMAVFFTSHTPVSTLKIIWSRRRPVTRLNVSGTWKISKQIVACFYVKKYQRGKKKRKILVHGSRQHLSCSLMPACLRCRTRTYYCTSMYFAALYRAH